ncbi:MAG: hypothetical protein IJI36_19385, partial [Kiritimatiellae bacterium]|nr:hypothetical protein [Kiritimatiellia bacterium]
MKQTRLTILAALLAVCGALSASDKTISGDYVVAAGGETYDNVTVTATATISGGTLTIADGGTITVSAGTASFTCPITMGTTSAGKVTLAPAAGSTADFTGKISGPADIDIVAAANSGVVKFTSSESDYDGNLLLTQGTFHAKGNAAFGSTAGCSTFTNLAASGACVYFDGFTTSERIVLSQSSPSVADGWHIERVWFTADCTFNGAFTDGTHAGREWGWNFTNGITVSFNGSFSGFGSLMGAYSPSCTATINFNCSPTYSGTWYWQGCILNMRARRSATDAVRLRGGTYNFYVDRHFVRASDNWVPVMIFETADAVTFNLINGEQQFVRISENKSGAACVITSASGQTFKLLNTGADSTFAGKFTGDVNFSLQGDRTVTLTGKSDTTGTLVLSNTAKVVFADGSFWGGRLAFQSGDGSQLITLNNGSMAVSELKIGGVKMPDGVYGSSASSAPAANQLSCFAGSGIVKVQGGLVVNGSSYQVAAGGETYTSVIVSNNATITGGPLTVLDGGRITVAAGKTAAFQSALTLGDVGNSKVVIAPEAGATADFTGKISGLADIDIIAAANSGVVKFTSSESDYDGNLL